MDIGNEVYFAHISVADFNLFLDSLEILEHVLDGNILFIGDLNVPSFRNYINGRIDGSKCTSQIFGKKNRNTDVTDIA